MNSPEFIVPHMHNSTGGHDCLLWGKNVSDRLWHIAVDHENRHEVQLIRLNRR
jgi:hypothetical protein